MRLRRVLRFGIETGDSSVVSFIDDHGHTVFALKCSRKFIVSGKRRSCLPFAAAIVYAHLSPPIASPAPAQHPATISTARR